LHESLIGTGKLTFPDGGWYEGEFHDNEISGRGKRKFSGGNTYTGKYLFSKYVLLCLSNI
jgi:hypothetical protein